MGKPGQLLLNASKGRSPMSTVIDPNLVDINDPRDFEDPTETFNTEIMGHRPENFDPILKAAMNDYAERPFHEKSSSESVELLHYQKELSWAQAREYRWLKLCDYEDVAARLINPIHSSRFITKLRNAGLECFYVGEVYNGLLALYVTPKKPYLDDNGHLTKEPRFATGVQYGYMPAYSVMRFDDHGVPLNERYRGYWTVLLRLILDGYATEKQIKEEFGEPCGPAGERTRSLLHSYRNTQ
jgi:hypothetical protein